MNTKIFTKNELSEAAAMIRAGGIVAMPTETVYGLAANALNEEAVQKVFAAKGRQSDNPLIVHIATTSEWSQLVESIPEKARLLADRFWPGPLTIILKKKSIVPDIVTAGLDTVAVRMPKNKIAFRFIKECGVPIAAPSANLSGAPSPTKFSHVLHDMNGRVDGIIDGGDCMVGLESTVISLAGNTPVILRPGRVTAEQIEKVIGKVELHHAVTEDLRTDETAASPGMKYKHYAPKAELTLLAGAPEHFVQYVQTHADAQTAIICYNETQDQFPSFTTFSLGAQADSITHAKRLFDILRAVDEQGFAKVLAPLPEGTGVSLAVKNRLLRAAGFRVVDAQSNEPEAMQTIPEVNSNPKPQEAEIVTMSAEEAIEDEVSTAETQAKAAIKSVNPIAISLAQAMADIEQLDAANLVENAKPIKAKALSRSNEPAPAAETDTAEADNEPVASEPQVLNLHEILEEDSSILALNDVQLAAVFNEDFSKEISDSITVIEKREEDDPSKIYYEALLDENGARPVAYPVDSIGDDFKFDVYDDDIEAQRNSGLFSFLRRKKKTDEDDGVEPEPFIPKRNPIWDADRPMYRSDDSSNSAAQRYIPDGKRIYEKIEGIRVVGLTGKTGSGKTYLTNAMAKKIPGSAIINADSVYHGMLETDTMVLSLVVAFGNDILIGNKVNRKALAKIAFDSEENLQKLNETVLPQVAEKIIGLIITARDKGIKTVFLDAPTLIESNLYQICDEVIYVTADASIRQERIVARDNITLDEVGQRMRFEKDDSFYVRYADRIIRNN